MPPERKPRKPRKPTVAAAVAEQEVDALKAITNALDALPKARRRELDAEVARRERFVADRLGAKSLADYLAGPKVDVLALVAADREFDKIAAKTPAAKAERREEKRYMRSLTSTAKPAAERATSPSPAMEAPTAADHTPETPTPRRRLRAGHGGYLII